MAERLGQWLHVAEAIELHSARGTMAAAAASARGRSSRVAATDLRAPLRQELERVRGVLIRSITTRDPSHRPDPSDPDTEFALFQQRLNDQQRRMEMSVDALRQHVRQQLAGASPGCRQLAAMDALMDQLFAGREQRLLAGLPAFLKARFSALRQEAAVAGASEQPYWLNAFADDFEQALLAELELRLLPVVGLIESLDP